MSLARRRRDQILAAQSASAPLSGGGPTLSFGDAVRSAADTAAAQIQMRLTHDLRRLKEIQSIGRKIDAKREMLPEYRAWCDGLLALGRDRQGVGVAEEVLPTMMVWSIDVGDWPRALELATHVIAHKVPLPARYQRSAAALVVEEVATAALKMQVAGNRFPLGVLEQVEALAGDIDMHDEIRAKLMKAIGAELAADDGAAERALAALRKAQALHERVGVKDRIKRLEKTLAARTVSGGLVPPPPAPTGVGGAELSCDASR